MLFATVPQGPGTTYGRKYFKLTTEGLRIGKLQIVIIKSVRDIMMPYILEFCSLDR